MAICALGGAAEVAVAATSGYKVPQTARACYPTPLNHPRTPTMNCHS
jgi:hypothetical protein